MRFRCNDIARIPHTIFVREYTFFFCLIQTDGFYYNNILRATPLQVYISVSRMYSLYVAYPGIIGLYRVYYDVEIIFIVTRNRYLK